MDVPGKSKPPRYSHVDRLPQLAEPYFEASLEEPGTRMNHQILRRTFATLACNSGGDHKDIKAQIRRANVNTTANVLTKSVPKSVSNAVDALDRRIRKGERKKKTKQTYNRSVIADRNH